MAKAMSIPFQIGDIQDTVNIWLKNLTTDSMAT